MHDRLAARDVMGRALEDLVQSADNWTFYVKRSVIDWGTGDERAPGLVIQKGEPIQLGTQIDSRLVRSKRVRLVLSWKDGGAVEMDLTSRTSRELTPSPTAKKAPKEFSEEIAKDSGSRLVTPGGAALLIGWPIIWTFFVTVLTTIFDAPTRRAMLSTSSSPPPESVAVPDWSVSLEVVGLVSSPFMLALAALVMFRIYSSGGLRIRRTLITKLSILSLLYKVRTEGLRLENWREIIVGVSIGVLIVLLTLWVS